MGLTRCCIPRFLSTCRIQWPESTVLSLHINNVFAKKIIHAVRALMISQNILWLQESSMVQLGDVAVVTISVLLMKPLPIVLCLRRRAPHHCGDPDPSRIIGRMSVVFLSPPALNDFWKVSKHGAFSIPRQTLGLRASDQSCHHETWLHLHFVDWSNQWNHQAHHIRSHFGSRALSVQVNIVAVSDHVFHRFLFDLLIQVSGTQFSLFLCILFRFDGYRSCKRRCIAHFLARVAASVRMLVLLTVLVTTSMEWAPTPEERYTKNSMPFSLGSYTSKRRSLKFLLSSKTLGDFASRLTEMEENFSAITARVCKSETHAASASNVSGSARSWSTLEQVDGSTAAGSHGPGSSDDNRNTRRRLDPSSSAEDEQSRSGVLFRTPCEQYLKRSRTVDRDPLG